MQRCTTVLDYGKGGGAGRCGNWRNLQPCTFTDWNGILSKAKKYPQLGLRVILDVRLLLYCVLGRHFFRVVITRGISHVPSIPSNVLGVDISTVLLLPRPLDYLLHGSVVHDLRTAEIPNFHRFLASSFLRHVIFS